jgi:hypothetical protein
MPPKEGQCMPSKVYSPTRILNLEYIVAPSY